MRTIERNYRKNPHTANFLMTFHTGGKGLPADLPEVADDTTAQDDLLDLIPTEHVADHRSPRQAELMARLVEQITNLDYVAGRQAREYTESMTERGRWTAGREGNASDWISRMIAKVGALIQSLKSRTREATVADGRYAVEEDGTLEFFKVKNGNRAGFVFLDVQASDDWHAVRNVTRIRAILDLIAADARAALVRYGVELGECGRCGKALTDEASRAAGIGPVCITK